MYLLGRTSSMDVWQNASMDVIGKLERRSSQPPAFLGHSVAWYHPVGICCLVFVSSPARAPHLVVIIGRVSGTGNGGAIYSKKQSLLLASR
jgi:hypothetical protein